MTTRPAAEDHVDKLSCEVNTEFVSYSCSHDLESPKTISCIFWLTNTQPCPHQHASRPTGGYCYRQTNDARVAGHHRVNHCRHRVQWIHSDSQGEANRERCRLSSPHPTHPQTDLRVLVVACESHPRQLCGWL